MALMITEEYINCQLCEDECPNQAISAANERYVIDADCCTECVGHYDAPSCTAVCPVDCIVQNPQRRESLAELAEKYARLHA